MTKPTILFESIELSTLIQVSISDIEYKTKPEGDSAFRVLNNSLYQKKLTVREFMGGLDRGSAFCPAVLSGRRLQKNYVKSHTIAVDFDGNQSPAAMISLLKEENFNVNIYYSTLRDSPNWRRFRLILFLNQDVNKQVMKDILAYIIVLTGCDDATIDTVKLYLGGKNSEFLSDKPTDLELILPFIDRSSVTRSAYQSTQIKKRWAGHIDSVGLYKKKDFDFVQAAKYSKIFRDFTENEETLPYLKLRNLASNLMYVTNGLSWMQNIMDKCKCDYAQKDYDLLANVIKYRFFPEKMENFEKALAPWFPNVIALGRPILLPIEKLDNASLDTVNERLRDTFKVTAKGFYGIKAMTGLGKTLLITEHIEKHLLGKKVVIAQPTHDLIKETCAKLPNVPHWVFPVFMLPHYHNEYRDLVTRYGVEKAFSLVLGRSKSKAAKNEVKDIINLDYILSYQKETTAFKLFDKNLVYLLTHQQFLKIAHKNRGPSLSGVDRIFVDEDPFLATYPIVSLTNIQYYDVLESYEHSLLKVNKLDSWATEGSFIRDFGLAISYFKSLVLDEIVDVQAPPFEDQENFRKCLSDIKHGHIVIKLFSCKHITFTRGCVHGIFIYNIPPSVLERTTITSATMDRFFYAKAFPTIEIIEMPQIKHKVPVTQFVRRMNSKSQFNKNPQCVPYIEEGYVITYKGYNHLFQEEHFPGIYFGNIEGKDGLKGKPISIVGTPINPPYVTLLIATALGLSFTKEDTTKIMRSVVLDGREFLMMTFKGESLTQVEIRNALAILEQCLGRGRGLRTYSKATVYSNLPCAQTDHFLYCFPPKKGEVAQTVPGPKRQPQTPPHPI